MIETELARAAGFFDGEGCVSQCRKNEQLSYVTMTVNQYSNRRVVDRFRDAVGEGTVRGPDKRGDYRWQVTGRVAARVMERLRPYLTDASPKVEKFCRLKDEGVR